MKSYQNWTDITRWILLETNTQIVKKLIGTGKYLFLSSRPDGHSYILRHAQNFIHKSKE